MDDHIHTPNDGRGFNRRVFVDGRRIDRAFYADTRMGVVRAYENPPRVVGDELAAYELHGKVEVVDS